jgi:acetoin utilization protein AcuA
MFEKQFNHRTHETSLGPVDIEGPVPSQTLATYTLDLGLTAFRPPAEQHQALVEIADLEEGRIIVARQGTEIIGYVTYLYPDPYETRSEGNNLYILELGAIEVSSRFRGQQIGKKLLEISMLDPAMEHYLILTTEYYWHWDLNGSGLSVWDYRKIMEKMMYHGGLVLFPTDDPEIVSHPANCLMARIGTHVSPEVVAHFDALPLRRRFMYD